MASKLSLCKRCVACTVACCFPSNILRRQCACCCVCACVVFRCQVGGFSSVCNVCICSRFFFFEYLNVVIKVQLPKFKVCFTIQYQGANKNSVHGGI